MAKFQPGQSGNPAGRKKGSTNASRAADLRDALLSRAPAILNNLIQRAVNGDTAAAKVLLDRVIPPLKATEPPIRIEIKKGWSLAKQAEVIQRAAYDGEISVPQSQALMANLIDQAKIIESSGFIERVSKLETLEKLLQKHELTNEKEN